MGGLDFYSVIHTSFNPETDMQKWELEYVSDGYYRVKNVYSGYYLTASYAGSPGAEITEQYLSSSNNAQLWKFNELGIDDDYNREYKITSKSHEGDGWDMALAGDSNLTSYGYLVIQDPYMDDADYYDEWVLIPCFDAYLLGITNTTSGHNHISALYLSENYLKNAYFDVTTTYTSSMTAATVVSHMQNSDFFIIRGDGNYDNNGSYMYLHPTDTSKKLHASNLYSSTNTGLDLTDCDVAVFAGCHTAYHPNNSLPQAAVNAGVVDAIGFVGEPDCSEISAWTYRFTEEYLINVIDVEEAVWKAAIGGNDMELLNYIVE